MEGINDRTTDIDRQYWDMLEGREGFGISPSRAESPTKTAHQGLSPQRIAQHKAIGGRIVQENEIKLQKKWDEHS